MKSKHTLGAMVVFWLAMAAWLHAQSSPVGVPQKHPLAFPIGIAAPAVQPPASLECVVDFGPAAPIAAVAFSPDGKTLAVGGYQEVLLWDLANAKLAKRVGVGQLGNVVRTLAFRKDGRSLVVGEGSPRGLGGVKVLDLQTGQLAASLPDPRDVVSSLGLSPDGKLVAVGGADRLVHVWNLDDKKLLTAIKEHGARISGASFSADGKFLATAGTDKSLRVWEVGSWKLLSTMEQTEIVHAAAFNPDGSLLALAVGGPDDRAIHIRRRDNSQEVRVLDTGLGLPLDICWVAAGNRIFAACSDKTVKVFDANGGLVANLSGHSDWVYCVAASPDGTKLASGSADGTVKLWNVADGRLLATFVQISPRTEQWLIVTPPGYLATSAAGALQWRPKNLKTPPDKLASLLQNPDLLRQTIAGAKTAPPAVQ
jgi:WD40 repeat protein